MTEKRAIDILNELTRGMDENGVVRTANVIAIKALEKQMPNKPYDDKSDERTLLKCPICKYIFVTQYADESLCGGRMSKHCPECGQALAWKSEAKI